MERLRFSNRPESGPSKLSFIGLWVGLLLLLFAILFGLYYSQSKQIVLNTQAVLKDVSHFKVEHIQSWLNQRIADARTFSHQPQFVEQVKNLQHGSYAEKAISDRFKAFSDAHDYDKISLFDAFGHLLIQVGEIDGDHSTAGYFDKSGNEGKDPEEVHTEIFFDDENFHLDIVAPLIDQSSGQGELVGELVLHVDPRSFLIPFMQDWPTASDTAETLLVARDGDRGVVLNPPKFTNGESTEFLRLERPKRTLKRIFEHLDKGMQEGFFQSIDYRQQPIFLNYQKIDDTDWIIVAKIDRKEVYKPLYQLLFWVAAIGVLALLLIGFMLIRILKTERARREAELIEERQDFLEASQKYFISLFMDAPVAYQLLNQQGNIVDVNNAWCDLFEYECEEVIGRHYTDFMDCNYASSYGDCAEVLMQTQDAEHNLKIIRKDGSRRLTRFQVSISQDSVTGEKRVHCLLTDITRQFEHEQVQQKTLLRTQALFELILKAPSLDEKALMEMAMNQIEALSLSQIGFVHFVDEDQNSIGFVTWSSNTLKNHCTAMYDSHYPVEKAGIWADCIRKGEAVVINDYAAAENKTGLPEGHSTLKRFVSVPIFHQGLVRMIIGVGNAQTDYDEFDVETIKLFGSELYQIVLLKRAYDDLNVSEKRFHHLFSKAPVAYQSLGEDGKIAEMNEAWLSLFGFDAEEAEKVKARSFEEFMPASDRDGFQQEFANFLAMGEVHQKTFQIVRKDGTVRDVEVTGQTSHTHDNHVRTHCMLLDITDKLKTERTLKMSAKVFEYAGEGIMVTDPQRRIVSVNKAFTDILGYTEEEAIGNTPRILHSGKHDPEFYQQLWGELVQKGYWQGEIWNRSKSGELIPEWLTITELRNDDGEVENYIGVFADISKVKASEAELDFISFHDVLTALPNRQKFMVNLDYAIQHSKRRETLLAVLMLDLDRFKEVNDSFGHGAGDEVLMEVAKILRGCIRETDFIARFGGDEFAILLDDLSHADDAARIARKLIDAISEPITLAGKRQTVSVGCSIGISLFPDHGQDPDTLMQHADSALYLSKQEKSGSFEYFSSEMTYKAQERITIEVELKSAIKNNQLRVYYQPQVEVFSGKIIGAEALVRWQHPELGLMSPAYFIGVAEESGLIADIGEWVLNETCRQVKQWHDRGVEGLVFAVNVAPKQMVYRDMLATVMKALSDTGLPAEMLELEITEGGLLTIGEGAISLFDQLRGLGVKIAIDDFGTGYSSLAYLKALPLDVLKIDKQFVDDIPHDEAGMQIVNTIISMGHNLHLDVLAEGVETEFQREFLRLKGCDFYQGYLMSPPVDAQTFEAEYLNLEPSQE